MWKAHGVPSKQELIDREVLFRIGELARRLRSGSIKEEDLMNSDETHFVINFHNHKTLSRRGDVEVKYADVVGGEEGMKMMVLLSGGNNASIQPPMMISKNDASSYPIRGVEDNVPGVCYRTGPKGWMDSRVFGEWLKENRAVGARQSSSQRILYIDNCSGHAVTPEIESILRSKDIKLRFFPANATDLVQPADSHLIQKVKEEWRNLWNEKLLELIKNKCWVDPQSGSGKLVNPGKKYFLKMAAAAVRAVNKARHKKDGVLYARSAMIRCGMALNLNGQWEEHQLSEKLQCIIEKYRENFDGEPGDASRDLEGETTETGDE